MLTFLKLLTKSGRKDFVRDALDTYLTDEYLTEYAVKGANLVLDRIKDKDRLAVITTNIEVGTKLLGTVSSTMKDGVVTDDEAEEIRKQVTGLTGSILTKERVEAFKDLIVGKVP